MLYMLMGMLAAITGVGIGIWIRNWLEELAILRGLDEWTDRY